MKSHYNFLTTVYNNFPQKYSQKATHIFPLKVRWYYEVSFMIVVDWVAIKESFMSSDYDLCPFCVVTVLYAILSLKVQDCSNSSSLTMECFMQDCSNSSALTMECLVQDCSNSSVLTMECLSVRLQ